MIQSVLKVADKLERGSYSKRHCAEEPYTLLLLNPILI
jgi:hypothetical protein